MIAFTNQRISIKLLINHPFKQNYLELKSIIPNLKNSQPSLCNMFSKKHMNNSQLYTKSWSANFDEECESEEEEL